jgi:hypothetical protein
MSGKTPKLIPADRRRCQAEKPNGPFRMGGPAFTRCGNRPTLIAKETKPGADGRCGSMSLCPSCHAVFTQQVGMAGFAVEAIR